MSKRLSIAAAALLFAAQSARAGQSPIGSMPIPATAAELAKAAGIHRVDASTLPLDIVRIAFASPDGTSVEQAAARAAIAGVLGRAGSAGDVLPLPLTAKTWTSRILGLRVADERIAAAIFGTRPAALLYHALMGVDLATLAWIESNPAFLDVLIKHPGVSAVYARSIRIRDGRVVTPGDGADEVWAAVVGADPAHPAKFLAALLSARSGRVAGLYDAVAHLDGPRQAFAIGKAGDAGRVARAQRLLDGVTRLEPRWRVTEHPFMRPNVDAAVLLRAVRVSAGGELLPPASRDVWSRVFGGAQERGPIDAAWLAEKILERGDSAAREHLDVFLFGQRALASAGRASEGDLVDALHGFRRYPALMLTLEGHGLDAAGYAAAARAAAAVNGDDDAVAMFQAGVAIVDLARRSGAIDAAVARRALTSLVDAGAARESRARLLGWVRTDLLSALKGAVAGGHALDADALVIAALAGPRPAPGPPIVWEEQQFHADLSTSELRRLTAIRKRQDELPLDAALAATSHKLTAIVMSMTALVYANALGDPDGQPANAGPVWRRHRLDSTATGARSHAWRLANESFEGEGWHLTGSLLRLDVALAPLALRRLDSTEMPTPSVLSNSDRRILTLSMALIDPRLLTDDDRDAVAAALARGRARAAALATNAAELDAAADAAGLSEWRRNALRWSLATSTARAVVESFTLLELFRLGGGDPRASWGAAAVPLEGCLCLRFPAPVPWEEYGGRAATGQLATQFADVMLRTAEALATRRLPALLGRHIAAFAMQDVIDRARPTYFDDWLPVAFAARDLRDDQFDDYIATLTVAGPLVPVTKGKQ